MASGSVHPFCLFIDILNTRDASLAINYELKWSHKKLATTGKSCANKKLPFSQIDISLLANFGCFLEEKGFLAERKNGRFSVIPAGTRSTVIVGHYFDGPEGPTKFR